MRQPHLERYLYQLVEQGYGSTIREVADYLVDREIDDLLRCKVLTPLSKAEMRNQPTVGKPNE